MNFLSFEQLFYVYIAASVFFVAGGVLIFIYRAFKNKKILTSALNYILYEITLPIEAADKKDQQAWREMISVMEQFYVGMSAIFKESWFRGLFGETAFFLELALPSAGEETTFYAAFPRKYARLFLKQLQSVFPHARAEIKKEDYNIFNLEGGSAGGYLVLTENPALPIRTYQRLNADPLEVIANAFSKLKKEGEGASIQIAVAKEQKGFRKKLAEILKNVRAGKGLKIPSSMSFLFSGDSQQNKKEDKPPPVDEEMIKFVEEKAGFPMFNVNMRLVASAQSSEEAQTILQELSSAFKQFNEPRGNSFKINQVFGRKLEKLFYNFSFRLFDRSQSMLLNSRELTSIFHFPSGLTMAPKIKFLKAKEAPAPVGLPLEGILIGENVYRGEQTPIMLSRDDRRRHLYIIGQTGTGKTAFIQNMVKQDIESGHGLCVIDPHGDMVETILGYIPEKRTSDVIYFDPSITERPFGFNFLEYDPAYPEQKTFIVNELLEIFRKLYADIPEALGPMFETYFRNATLLVMEDPASGNTLFEIERVMTDKNFRDLKLSRSRNPVVRAFWSEVAEKAGGEAALANIVPYITSKFDAFLTNEFMRPILLQEKSSINFREILDHSRIFLVNLSKGRIGETNALLLGLIIVGKLLMAALSRVNIAEEERRDFYLYLDEFQNITTPSIATILSEARKYRLNLIIAHQFIGQLSEEIKLAVFGNVGSIVSFRIGADDAEFIQKQFEPVFSAHDLLNIDNFNAYLKILVKGQTARPFNIKTFPPQKGEISRNEQLKSMSALKYGRPRTEIETEISQRYQQH